MATITDAQATYLTQLHAIVDPVVTAMRPIHAQMAPLQAQIKALQTPEFTAARDELNRLTQAARASSAAAARKARTRVPGPAVGGATGPAKT